VGGGERVGFATSEKCAAMRFDSIRFDLISCPKVDGTSDDDWTARKPRGETLSEVDGKGGVNVDLR
jgi:hypothetical protein